MRRRVIGRSRVNKPYGVDRIWCLNWVCFMPHYEHSAMAIIVGIRGIIRELPVGWSWLSFLHSALLFLTCPSFPQCPHLIRLFWQLDMVGWLPLLMNSLSVSSDQLTMSAFVSSAESFSLVRLGVEHLTIWHIAPWSNVIFFNHQYRLKIIKGGRLLPCENGQSERAKT